MQVSAECRWFWRDPEAGALLHAWFTDRSKHHECSAGGGELRSDTYLKDLNQSELGIKKRGDKPGVEVKGLVAVMESQVDSPPFLAPIELWTKWTTTALSLDSLKTLRTSKRRWLRKFDTSDKEAAEIALDKNENRIDARPLPIQGCNVEFTEITLGDEQIWYTIGFEAFGGLRSVELSLRICASEMAQRITAFPSNERVASYPLWLSTTVVPQEGR